MSVFPKFTETIAVAFVCPNIELDIRIHLTWTSFAYVFALKPQFWHLGSVVEPTLIWCRPHRVVVAEWICSFNSPFGIWLKVFSCSLSLNAFNAVADATDHTMSCDDHSLDAESAGSCCCCCHYNVHGICKKKECSLHFSFVRCKN